MESAFAWLGQLVEWFGKLFPRYVILDTTEGAVKFVGGKKPIYLPPGIHWYWPFRTTLHTYPTARQADDLRSQSIVTADDKVVVVGGLIVYEVKDLLVLLSTVHNAATSIVDIALTAIHDVCCQMSWADLKKEQRNGKLDTKLKNTTQKALNEYGVKVIKVMLTDLAPTLVLKLLQSVGKDE